MIASHIFLQSLIKVEKRNFCMPNLVRSRWKPWSLTWKMKSNYENWVIFQQKIFYRHPCRMYRSGTRGQYLHLLNFPRFAWTHCICNSSHSFLFCPFLLPCPVLSAFSLPAIPFSSSLYPFSRFRFKVPFPIGRVGPFVCRCRTLGLAQRTNRPDRLSGQPPLSFVFGAREQLVLTLDTLLYCRCQVLSYRVSWWKSYLNMSSLKQLRLCQLLNYREYDWKRSTGFNAWHFVLLSFSSAELHSG